MKKIFLFLSLSLMIFLSGCDNEPLEIELIDGDVVACETATTNALQAALAFIDATEENYSQICSNYASALNTQILSCGDPGGILQQQLDALGDCTLNPIDDCDAATEALNLAQLAFDNADDDNYTQACNAYQAALQTFIDVCGDPDGSVQAILDGLGDCTLNNLVVEISLTAGTLPVEFDMVEVVEAGNVLQVTGETSGPETYSVYFEVNAGETGVDIINDTFELTLTSVFFPSFPGFDDFSSEITENTMGTLVGTFGGIMENNDGGDLSVTSGVINISY